jgi:hypothetical protein
MDYHAQKVLEFTLSDGKYFGATKNYPLPTPAQSLSYFFSPTSALLTFEGTET